MTIATGPRARDETFLDLDEALGRAEPAPEAEGPDGFRIDPARDPVGLVFSSSRGHDRGGRAHVVTVVHLASGDEVTCSCAAVRATFHRPAGCAKMVRAREILGMPQPGGPGDPGSAE